MGVRQEVSATRRRQGEGICKAKERDLGMGWEKDVGEGEVQKSPQSLAWVRSLAGRRAILGEVKAGGGQS